MMGTRAMFSDEARGHRKAGELPAQGFDVKITDPDGNPVDEAKDQSRQPSAGRCVRRPAA